MGLIDACDRELCVSDTIIIGPGGVNRRTRPRSLRFRMKGLSYGAHFCGYVCSIIVLVYAKYCYSSSFKEVI